MRTIDGDKCDKFRQYVLASEAIALERELVTLREQLVAKNNFRACCDVIAHMPQVVQHIVQHSDHLEEKRISKMSGVWDKGEVRRQEYRVVLWHAKGGVGDFAHTSLRTAVEMACDKLHLPFPAELE